MQKWFLVFLFELHRTGCEFQYATIFFFYSALTFSLLHASLHIVRNSI